ncbi:hypothetical protein OMD49_30225 [Bacillus anthracis]|nr:hypothetical protein [Bacillus anthracis]
MDRSKIDFLILNIFIYNIFWDLVIEQLMLLTGLKALRKLEEAIDSIVKHDKLLPNLIQTYKIQAILFRELFCCGVDNPIADGVVHIQ